MLKLKRLKELIALFFTYLKDEGPVAVIRRATMFFKRRMRRKKGRFTPPAQALRRQREYIPPFENKTISVVTALYNTDRQFLKEFVDSFLIQSYQFGQLVLADASDEDHAYIGEFIKGLGSDRIKYIKLSENGGISANTNAAAGRADGDYICFADHDDILSPDALYQVAKAMADTGADLVYSDEALFEADWQNPTVPHLKPDYSYYYLTNCNYICHFVCVKKEIFEKAGGLDPEFDGAQDHDFLLRVSEIPGVKIHHIPKVLYYWRVHSQSTSGGMEAKPYVTERRIRAIDNHLERKGVRGKAREGLFGGTYKIDYEIQGWPLVSIIIPNKDRRDMLKTCIDSIYDKTDYKNYEIIIVENNSTDPATFRYYEELEKRENLKVVRYEGGFNFSRINNFAAGYADGDMLLLLNNDIEVINPGWLGEMVSLAEQDNVGIVGAKLYYPDGRIQHAGVITGLGGYAGHSHKYHPGKGSGYMFRLTCVQDLSCVTAACLLVNRAVFEKAEGLDERLTVAFNDVDFCLRVRDMGYHVLFTPYAECIHHESVSRGLDKKGEKKERFLGEQALLKEKHPDLLKDPYYNPNLTLDMEDFSESRVLPKYEDNI